MKILNDLQIKGVTTLGNFTNADLTAIGAPVNGLGSVVFNVDNQRLEQWDGTAWVATVPMVHNPVTIGTVGTESTWLSVDVNQVVDFSIPAGTFYTQAEVDAAIATAKQEAKDELIDGAPGTFDTLKDIADELAADNAQATQIIADIASNDTDIAALQAQAHDAITLAGTTDASLTLTGQELNLDLSAITTDIATNATNIASNDTDIATNATDIAANATDIASNDTDIAALQAALHDAVTLSGTSDASLTLSGQELTLDLTVINNAITSNAGDIAVNSTDIAALQAQAHDAVTLGANNSPFLSLTGQELTLEEKEKRIFETFVAGDFTVSGTDAIFTVIDADIDLGAVSSVVILDNANKRVLADYEVKSGSLDLIVNAIPNNAFDGSISIDVNLPEPVPPSASLSVAAGFPFTFQAQVMIETDGANGGLTDVNTWFYTDPTHSGAQQINGGAPVVLAPGTTTDLYLVSEYRQTGNSNVLDDRYIAANVQATFDGTAVTYNVASIVYQLPGGTNATNTSYNDVVAAQTGTLSVNTFQDLTMMITETIA